LHLHDYVRLPPAETPPEIMENQKWFPYFNDCIGAIDGSHIPAHNLIFTLQLRASRYNKSFMDDMAGRDNAYVCKVRPQLAYLEGTLEVQIKVFFGGLPSRLFEAAFGTLAGTLCFEHCTDQEAGHFSIPTCAGRAGVIGFGIGVGI